MYFKCLVKLIKMLRKNLNQKLLKYFLRFSVNSRINYLVGDYKRYCLREDTDFRYIVLISRGNHLYDSNIFSTLHIYASEDIPSDKDNEYVFNLFLLHRLFIYYN